MEWKTKFGGGDPESVGKEMWIQWEDSEEKILLYTVYCIPTHTNMYVYIYIYIIYMKVMFIYIYIYIFIYVHETYLYVYIYIHTFTHIGDNIV